MTLEQAMRYATVMGATMNAKLAEKAAQTAEEERPPDEGPNYRDFPGEERSFDFEAEDEVWRERYLS